MVPTSLPAINRSSGMRNVHSSKGGKVTMFGLRSVVILVIVSWSVARPSQPVEDVQIVESTLRAVRAAAPEDLLLAATSYGHDYGADDDDSVGYLKRTEDGGSDGYKHFDSYHKKDGDKYGYEKHTSFGKASDVEHDSENDKADADDKGSYKVNEEINEGDDGEAYEGEGQSEAYVEGAEEGSSGEHYTEGDDGAHYTEGENLGENVEYDDGESEKYTDAEGAEEDDDY